MGVTRWGHRGEAGPRREARAIWWISFTILFSFGALWAVSTPMLAAPDEDARAVKAAAVAFHGVWPVGTTLTVPRGLRRDRRRQGLPPIPPRCRRTRPPHQRRGYGERPLHAGGAVSSLYYTLISWPAHLLSPWRALYAMRLLSAMIGAALLASAIASVALMRPPGGWLPVSPSPSPRWRSISSGSSTRTGWRSPRRRACGPRRSLWCDQAMRSRLACWSVWAWRHLFAAARPLSCPDGDHGAPGHRGRR